ncbi:MAG: HAD family hydrolase [Synechococcales cyanobacterium C42_A2020_086]|jgi:putative hydrolase of the HAD superfamily|nr:HAD family hydrolase [Synechococcales cyanobacterium M58_A2018_015]MBF2072221.1 HAD family hydrolase [Synechococcales cyanobacterium C42_A2020_086]
MQQQDSTPAPRVIFLDAVGTLFGVKGSVGEIYSSMAQQFGVHVNAQQLDRAFLQSFQAAPPMAFPDTAAGSIPQQEYAWWEAIARQTFERVGALGQFTDFSIFFAVLYAHFATAEPWFLYSDVLQALEYWRSQGIELGVVSNFDTRLYPVLSALGLADFFRSVTISTEVGAAKPSPQVFRAALAKHQCSAEEAWHIGDSVREDYQGAKAAGLRAIWIKR